MRKILALICVYLILVLEIVSCSSAPLVKDSDAEHIRKLEKVEISAFAELKNMGAIQGDYGAFRATLEKIGYTLRSLADRKVANQGDSVSDTADGTRIVRGPTLLLEPSTKYTLKVLSKNKIAVDYVISRFETDLRAALVYAQGIQNLDLAKKQVNFVFADVPKGNPPNGVTINADIRAGLCTDPKLCNQPLLRAIVFHELGHFIHNTLLEVESNSWKESVKYKEQILDDSLLESPEGMETFKRAMKFSVAYANLSQAFEELIADVFMAAYLQDPSDHSGDLPGRVSRDFSKMSTQVESGTAEPHVYYNSTRGYLWKNFMSRNIHDPEKMRMLFKALVDISANEIDQRWANVKSAMLANANLPPENQTDDNQRLQSLLEPVVNNWNVSQNHSFFCHH